MRLKMAKAASARAGYSATRPTSRATMSIASPRRQRAQAAPANATAVTGQAS
jgi:hypothetical protein